MKISHISTGKKLDIKTFGELKPGDKLYVASPLDKSIEDITFTVASGVESTDIDEFGYSDLNPNKKAKIKFDIILNIEEKFGISTCDVPSNAKYIVIDNVVVTTDKELLLQIIKKYKLVSQLI